MPIKFIFYIDNFLSPLTESPKSLLKTLSIIIPIMEEEIQLLEVCLLSSFYKEDLENFYLEN